MTRSANPQPLIGGGLRRQFTLCLFRVDSLSSGESPRAALESGKDDDEHDEKHASTHRGTLCELRRAALYPGLPNRSR